MTKEITKAFVIQEIQDKFGLREFEPAKFLFDETVVPVYNVESHLQRFLVEFATKSITALDYYTYFVVPQNERWTLRGYNIIFITGVFTVAGALIHRGGSTYYMYLDLKAAQSASYIVNLNHPVILMPGDDLGLYADGYTSTGDLQMRADVMKEEIR